MTRNAVATVSSTGMPAQPPPLVDIQRQQSRRRILVMACLSRLVVLLGMMISCALLPDNNPGDDVVRVDLRLQNGGGPSSVALKEEEHSFIYYIPLDSTTARHTTFPILLQWYRVMLPPLTRWDAARFLALALDPNRRLPRNNRKNDDKPCPPPHDSDCRRSTNVSEEAHAFFPLVPLLIRSVSLLFVRLVPAALLPPTLEGVAALAGWSLNTVAFVLAALALFELTRTVIMMAAAKQRRRQHCHHGDSTHHDCCNTTTRMAETASLLFCFNPASVFFSTCCYSESVFACLTFGGYAVMERTTTKQYDYNHHCYYYHYWCRVLVATVLWMAASYARSNGTLVCLWMFLRILSWLFGFVGGGGSRRQQQQQPATANSSSRMLMEMMIRVCGGLCMMGLVVLPVWYHDRRGFEAHCGHRNNDVLEQPTTIPEWCQDLSSSSSFYGYVQRKHWNVGLFRYYQWKQLPNFLLAFPILLYGVCASATWICTSWQSFVRHQKQTLSSKQRFHATNPMHILCWALYALRAASDENNVAEVVRTDDNDDNLLLTMLLGPTALAHYATLAAACLVGATIAHVQISTRLICSSCPAVYWYLAYLWHRRREDDSIVNNRSGVSKWRLLLLSQRAILSYCAAYILLGVILHVNWLPWT